LTSGSPFDVSIASTGSGPSVRPNLTSTANLHLHPTPANNYQILNKNDFSAPATNLVTGYYLAPGNVHKNQFRGSGYSDLSLSVFKDIPIHDNIVAQLRGQFYNVFNSPAFAPPSNTQLAGTPSTTGTFANLTNVDYFAQRLTEIAFRIQF